ncbi:MAG: hypothetical protein DLM73_03550 [Chthoniobacterales bacterium]|nr:MAG: hypothetical protein DLM73_03550 [Chthoniobacterales bacterium]
MPGIGEIPGAVAAGLVPVTDVAGGTTGAVAGATAGVIGGCAPGGLTGGAFGGGGVWPNEVSARVTEQRLAISSVFIGLIGKFSRARIR